MKTRHYLLDRVAGLTQSGSSSTDGESTIFGATFALVVAGATAIAVFETSVDGGTTWTTVVSFTLDSSGSVFTPPIEFAGGVLRARVIAANGSFLLSCWTE
jgi:hypothetical protein